MSLTTRVPFTVCPECGHKLDSATSYQNRKPIEGAISVCVGCGGLAVFNADWTLRALTPEEKREVSMQPHITEMQILIRGRRKQ
jgi:hypothetical protein